MESKKKERTEEIIHRLAAQFALEESSSASLLTITRVTLSPTGKEAQIFFTTLPESEQETAHKFLIRKTPEFRHFVRENSRIGIIPQITFKIDFGERNRQHLDTLS